jgi:hypothetical protein
VHRHAFPSPAAARRRHALSALTFAAVVAAALTACDSASPTASAAITGTAIEQQCTSVADVLSDGPDPNADPVGYAEAQVLPLRQLKIINGNLRAAVRQLADAYEVFSSTDGRATAEAIKVSEAEGKIDALCPKGVGTQLLPGQAVP